jgi:hypothetical protein
MEDSQTKYSIGVGDIILSLTKQKLVSFEISDMQNGALLNISGSKPYL